MNNNDTKITSQEESEIKVKLDIFGWLKDLEESCLKKGTNPGLVDLPPENHQHEHGE